MTSGTILLQASPLVIIMIPTETLGFAFCLLGIISIVELGLIYGYTKKKAPGQTYTVKKKKYKKVKHLFFRDVDSIGFVDF